MAAMLAVHLVAHLVELSAGWRVVQSASMLVDWLADSTVQMTVAHSVDWLEVLMVAR